MKYLDERIGIQMDFGSPMPAAGLYRYDIYEYDARARDDSDELIFTGNYYYDRNGRYKTIDFTDIVRSRKFIPSMYGVIDESGLYNQEAALINSYRIRIYLDNSNITSSWLSVAMVHRYPNLKRGINNGTNVFEGTSHSVVAALQGYNADNGMYKACALIPHYPLIRTKQLRYEQAFVHNATLYEWYIDQAQTSYSNYYTVSAGQGGAERSTAISVPLYEFLNSYVNVNKDMNLYLVEYDEEDDENKFYLIGAMDSCPKRYYLQWMDRFGGIQCQGFNDYATFTESFKTTETQNYKNERKKSFIEVQPKWKISSGWISEDLYPFYESIQVSPFLILYDSQEDYAYQVILKDTNYTEKTYRTEKKLINLTLELEKIAQQNIIY